MIYCVLKCDFDGFKIAVNKGVTIQRFPPKGNLWRAGDVVLALPPYCYYIASSVLLILKKTQRLQRGSRQCSKNILGLGSY